MIDLHCHILPGIDDGPGTMEETVALARAAVAAGTRTVVATPHVSWDYPNDAAVIAPLVDQVNRRLASEGVPLEVLPGAEIAMTRLMELGPADVAGLGLGGSRWLLIEPPLTAFAGGIDTLLTALQPKGHRIVLAHPERCLAFHRDPEILRSLVQRGVLVSITAGSLVGRFGKPARELALRLVKQCLVHNVASDAHDDRRRPPGITSELRRAELEPLAEWLTEQVPAAVLHGEGSVPRRPDLVPALGSTRAHWWSRRLG